MAGPEPNKISDQVAGVATDAASSALGRLKRQHVDADSHSANLRERRQGDLGEGRKLSKQGWLRRPGGVRA